MKLFKKVSNIAISLTLLLQLSGLTPFIGSQLAKAAQVCSQDSAGANDVPGQKDLTLMCVDYGNVPTTITTKWNWDDTGSNGNNSMDACSLFDTNGDGFANYAVCVTTKNDPAVKDALTTYSCGDTRPDRCTSSTAVIGSGTTSCTVAIANTNPFDNGNDAVATCIIALSTIGGANALLLDVCSYPSQQPNSDPSDCIVRKADTGKLEVRKVLSTNNSDTFNLLVDSVVKASGVVSGGTTSEILVTSGNHTVGETAATGSLAGYTKSIVCKDLNGTGSIVAQNATGSTLTVPVADRSDVVCVITNTQLTATITLVKQVANTGATTTPAAPNDFNLKLSGNGVLSGTANTITPGTYTASEVNLPGYTAGTWTGTGCNANGSITIAANQNITCTITNTAVAPTLTVVKQVVNDNGGAKQASDFTLLVNGITKQQNLAQNITAGTSYTVSEQSVAGYTQESIICKDSTTQQVVAHPVVASLGQSVTCKVTNNDQAPSLTLSKIVSNAHGGTATASQWTLAANGPTPISGAGSAVSPESFKAGTYALSESAGPSGYQASNWSCTSGISVTSGQVTILNGQSTVCSITNSDVAPVITITKVVNNNYGGTATATSFDLFLGTTQVVSGRAYTSFNAGSYTVSESPKIGYKFVSFSGDCNLLGFTVLAIGSTPSCTVTNEDIAPQLTVVKHVINQYGGNDSASSFTMQVIGTNVSSPTFPGSETGTTVTLNTGEYSAGESLKGKGYEQTTSGDCSGTIALGEHKYCTITNTDITPKIKVVKTVVNDNGGSLSANDFGIKVGATSPVFNIDSTNGSSTTYVAIVPVASNTPITVSEQDVAGYAEGTWACTNEAPVNGLGVTFTLAEAEYVRCEITNNDIAPTITIKKRVVGRQTEVFNFTNDYTVGREEIVGTFNLTGSPFLGQGNVFSFNPDAGTATVTENVDSSIWTTYITCTRGKQTQVFTGASIDITVVLGERVTCEFCNIEKSTIEVVKFEDLNKNGVKDAGESILDGWVMHASLSDGKTTTVLDATTANGKATFTIFAEFGYDFTIGETQKLGWTRTALYCDTVTSSIEFNPEVGLLLANQQPQAGAGTTKPGDHHICYVGNHKDSVTPPVVAPPMLSKTGVDTSVIMYLMGAVLATIVGLEISKKRV